APERDDNFRPTNVCNWPVVDTSARCEAPQIARSRPTILDRAEDDLEPVDFATEPARADRNGSEEPWQHNAAHMRIGKNVCDAGVVIKGSNGSPPRISHGARASGNRCAESLRSG